MEVIEIKEKELDKNIKTNKKVVIDCYAPWCGPCRMLAPIIDELADKLKDVKFYKINIDEAFDLAKKYSIMSIPTILVFEEGKLKNKIIGLQEKEELEQLIQ